MNYGVKSFGEFSVAFITAVIFDTLVSCLFVVSSVAHLCKLELAAHSAGEWPLVGVGSEMVKILPLVLDDNFACLLLVSVVALEKANALLA